MKSICWFQMWFVCIIFFSVSAQSERIVEFPSEVSIGRLFVNDSYSLDPYNWQDWQDIGLARGKVRVPAEKALRLDISRTGSLHLDALKSLKPDDVQMIGFDFDVNDIHFAQLVGIKGIKALYCYSPNVSDAGLMYISKLTSLVELDISEGHFTDEGLRLLTNLKSLQSLDLDGTEITDAGLEYLKQLPSIKKISLSQCERISDTGIAQLAQIKSLEKLYLYHARITGSGFSHFDPNASLREVTLNFSTITDEGVEHLARIKNLEKLGLYETKISDEGIFHLKNSNSLRSLIVGFTGVSDIGIAALSKITSLESLHLSLWNTDAVLKDITGLKHLKELHIAETKITGTSLEQLSEFREMEVLWLPPISVDRDFSFFKEMPRLKEFFIRKTTLTAEDMNYLSYASSLKRLEVYDVDVEENDYSALGKLNNLEELYWNPGPQGSEHAIGDEILKGITGLKKLRTLSLSGCSLTSEGFQLLSTLPSLNNLRRIQISEIVDDKDNHLGRLKNLKVLYLSGDNIPPGSLEKLHGLKSLQELTLSMPVIDTRELLPLADLESLRILDILNLTLESDSIEHLKTLGEGFQLLRIFADELSYEEMNQINKQVPNCHVIRPSDPVSIGPVTLPKTINYPKLAGKELPEIEEFGIELDLAKKDNTAILICFFDIEQRPSRNCMTKLSKRAKELKSQGVEIVAVHASKIEKEKLNDWTQENDISLQIGMIEDNEEKTRNNWGVQSLPWLILTDKNHIVTAEGFSIDTLDEKIKEIK